MATTVKIDTDVVAALIAEHLLTDDVKAVTVSGLEVAGYLRVEVEQ